MPRPHWHLRLQIIKDVPAKVEDFDTARFEVGQTYDVNAPLCDVLVASGYAVPAPPDERARRRKRTQKRPPKRRKQG